MALIAILTISIPTTYILASVYPAQLLPLPTPISLLLGPAHAPPPPEADSPHGRAMTEKLEREVWELDVVKQCKELVDSGDWYLTRPHSEHDPSPHNLTASVLRGPSKLAIRPVVFAKDDESEAVLVLHLGRSLCGHDGIIHGGLIATIFDESLARNALLNLPSKIGVTATLSLSYKKPTMADQWVVIRTKLDRLDGRKAEVYGVLEGENGEVLCSATALFVEPKWAKYLVNSGVSAALGSRPAGPDTYGSGQEEVGIREEKKKALKH